MPRRPRVQDGGTADRTRLTDAQLLALLRGLHAQYKAAYGSPRMDRELRRVRLPGEQDAGGAADARARPASAPQAPLQGDDRFEACAAGGGQRAGARLHRRRPIEPGPPI